MNIYSIFTNNSDEDSEPIIVKQGFSIWAGIFNVLWALYHKMWIIAAFAVVLDAWPLLFLDNHYYDELAFVNRIGIFLIFGFMATEMREHNLKSKGYELSDVLVAPSEPEAELKFFERSHAGHADSVASRDSKNSDKSKGNPFAMYENQEKVKP